MQNMSFHSQHWENIGTQVIHQDHWSSHLYLSQCHLLHNNIIIPCTWWNRETTRGPIWRTPSWRRERRQKRIKTRYFNLPNHCKQHTCTCMAVCGLSLHQGSTESCKTLEQKIIFQLALLILMVSLSMNAFHSTNLFFCFLFCHAPTSSIAPSFCI